MPRASRSRSAGAPSARGARSRAEERRPTAKAGHQCYHCKQWVEEGEAHDCWTTTEAALTKDLSEDLRDAWERLRETRRRRSASSGSTRRTTRSCSRESPATSSCVPKKNFLELCVFLGRTVKAPQVRRADRTLENQGRALHPRQCTGTKWNRPLPTGCRKRTTCWMRRPRRPPRREPDRSRNPGRRRNESQGHAEIGRRQKSKRR